jgi:catechol 2,3-dioxygenase-like lactoylglutathione lyase family enzyme
MRIHLNAVLVQDQQKALEFYTRKLGFKKSLDLPVGEHRWLTVVSPEDADGPELLLEPLAFEPARTYQKALFDAGIPLTSFAVDDCRAEHGRLKKLGVQFRDDPVESGGATVAVLDDTCGNLIQLVQVDG